jgi:hypothetical protein
LNLDLVNCSLIHLIAIQIVPFLLSVSRGLSLSAQLLEPPVAAFAFIPVVPVGILCAPSASDSLVRFFSLQLFHDRIVPIV